MKVYNVLLSNMGNININQIEINIDFYDKIHHILDLKGRMGITHYIDFLRLEEVKKNIMKGIDKFNRKFITIKVGIMDSKTGKLIRKQQVFFQRYSDESGWMGASLQGEFMETYGGMTEHQFKLLNDLVDGKTIIIEENHRISNYLNGDIIASMDTYEKKYAKIIQRNYFICRYNPEYKLCKKIVNKQYDYFIKGIDK